MNRHAAALAACLLAFPAAALGPFPARDGNSGLLDVPDAEAQGLGSALLGAELRLDLPKTGPSDLGPLPVAAVGGLGERLDVGFSLREWGQPGDPRPARLLVGAALKYQLLEPTGFRPGVALGLGGDRLNGAALGQARLIASTALVGRLRLAAFVGGEGLGTKGVKSGLTGGLALSLLHRSGAEVVAEALTGPRGANLGAAVRWAVDPTVGISLGVNWMPDDGVRISAGLAFSTPPRPKRSPTVVEAPTAPAPKEEPAAAVASLDDRPRFRLRIRQADPRSLGEPGHDQHAPWAPPIVAGAPPRIPAPPARAAAGADLAESQQKELALQVEARRKQLRATEDALADREVKHRAEAVRQEERETDLAAREQQLEAREKRLSVRGAPTQAQRTLESQEAQAAAAERQLAAVERGFAPALDAALGTERDAAAREQVERSEVERFEALAGLEKTKAKQADLRRQALAAKERMLAAMTARLSAKGDRLEVAQQQQQTRGQRLDAWQQRLETRAERVELLTRRAAEQGRGADLGLDRPALPVPVPLAGKDRTVFVTVIKSPTATMKARSSARAAGAGGRDAAHPGVSVEKSVAAATVVTFATPAARVSELDRESIDAIARLAAREGCELLIWARAKEPALMSEAIRRSEEIKSYVISSAGLDTKQVVTRITTRPGAQGVDVVISALRETAKAAPAAAAAPAPGAPARLAVGETARRQVRDAVVAVQPAIERCISEHMVRRGLTRAEGSLKLEVDLAGKVTAVSTGDGALGGPELVECLRLTATGWAFPPADGEYVIDVPITVVGGSGR